MRRIRMIRRCASSMSGGGAAGAAPGPLSGSRVLDSAPREPAGLLPERSRGVIVLGVAGAARSPSLGGAAGALAAETIQPANDFQS